MFRASLILLFLVIAVATIPQLGCPPPGNGNEGMGEGSGEGSGEGMNEGQGEDDPDGDGLTNDQEEALGTNPLLRDTDGDSFGDGDEVAVGTDPLVQDAVLFDDVLVVDNDPSLSVTAIDANTLRLTFSGDSPPSVAPGDILLSTEGDGYILRVTDIATGKGGASDQVVTVEAAGLNEAYNELTIDWSVMGSLDTEDTAQFPTHPLNDLILFENDTTTIRIVQGSVRFEPQIDLSASIDGGLTQTVSATASGELSMDIDLEIESTGAFDMTDTIAVASILIAVPGLPLLVELNLDLMLDANAEDATSVSAGFDATSTLTFGARIDNGELTNLSEIALTPELHGPSVNIAGNVDATIGIAASIVLTPYGQAGANISSHTSISFNAVLPCPPADASIIVAIESTTTLFADLLGLPGGDSIRRFPDPDEGEAPLESFIWFPQDCDELSAGGANEGSGEGVGEGQGEGSGEGIGEGVGEVLGEDAIQVFDLIEGLTLEMVSIPGGTFSMGSRDQRSEEMPVHEVTLDDFQIGQFEITKLQWTTLMGTSPWIGQMRVEESPNSPAVYVTWNEATAFARRLNQVTGESTFRLPTEAEWEYACRAGTTSTYFFGENQNAINTYAYWEDNTIAIGAPYPQEVGQLAPNQYRLYDILGNVFEWCSDNWDPDYYFFSPAFNPMGPETGSAAVLRGGSWFKDADQGFFRSSRRYARGRTPGNFHIGLRVARTIPEQP